jgi:hypothetical protein
MTTTPIEPACPDLAGPLATAASLVTTAALVNNASVAPIAVTVAGAAIDVQVPTYAGDEPTRAAAVAAYAAVLGSQVHHRSGEHHTRALIETRGVIAGHPVHVYTLAEAADEQEQR